MGLVGLAIALYVALPDVRYLNEPLHATIEAVGGCIAIGMAALLLLRWLEDGPAHFLWMTTALLCMGILDIVHACIAFSPAYFWSRALSTLFGGALMALVYLHPSPMVRKMSWGQPPLIAIVSILPVCAALLAWPNAWPNAFAPDGSYLPWAKALNISGGAAFAVATVFFVRRHTVGEHREADIVFGNQCMIFALAAVMFGLSHVYGALWWLFHMMRLAAYAVVLKYVVDVFRQSVKESFDLRQVEFERRLIGIVGHDLRNPLNAILLSSELIGGMALPTSAVPVLRRLVSSAQRMNRLVAELLDFSHQRTAGTIPITRDEVDLQSLCRTVREEFAASHPNISLTCESSGDVLGRWDRDRLHQVLVNLVENAIKHGMKSAPIRVTIRGEPGRVTLEVHSRGKAIPSNVLPHIFQAFRSGSAGENETRSHGLGLFIVSEIIKAHDGEIAVESTDEDGTHFRIVLPRDSAIGHEQRNSVASG